MWIPKEFFTRRGPKEHTTQRLERKLAISRDNLKRGQESIPPSKRKIKKSTRRIQDLELDIAARQSRLKEELSRARRKV